MDRSFCVNDYTTCKLPTDKGWFNFYVWKTNTGREPVALTTLSLDVSKPVVIRIHSECLTGDIFSSSNCDCGYQKEKALEIIQKSGNGIFLYDRQEGRGIGLFEKIKALNLQKEGLDTYEANIELGFEADQRNYDIPIEILKNFGVHDIKIITNNPVKIKALNDSGFNIIERISVQKKIDEFNEKYLYEKINIGKHLFD